MTYRSDMSEAICKHVASIKGSASSSKYAMAADTQHKIISYKKYASHNERILPD